MEEILSLAKSVAEEAEVFQMSSQKTSVRFEANQLKQVQTKESSSVALRIVREGKIGFSAAAGLNEPGVLVDMAVETSQFGMPAKFDFPTSKSHPKVEVFDPEVDKVTTDNMVELGERLIAVIKEHTPDILCEVSVTRNVSSVHIGNSKGGGAGYRKSLFALGVEGVLVQDGDMLFVGDSISSCHPAVDFKLIAEEVMRQLDLASRKANAPTGMVPVVFTPIGMASALISPLLLAFNGKMVLDGVSPLGKKRGKQVFDKQLSLWDDATLPYQPNSRICDDEGVSSRKTSLINKGVIEDFLYDLQTAALANTQSTGSGSRHGGLPSPSISSLVIADGEVAFEDMVRDMKRGLVVEQLIGAEQGNLLAGEFSGNVLLGYSVMDGEIVGRVKDTMVSGNVYQILSQIEAVGEKSRWVDGFLRTPCLYCPSLSVAAKAR